MAVYFFPVETDYTYQDIFTGMVFYKPIEQHIMSVGIPEIFDDQFMLTELKPFTNI
jgi:hypothetical protein